MAQSSNTANMATSLPSTMRAVQWRSAAGGMEKNLRYTANAALPKKAHSLPKDSVLVKVDHASVNAIEYKLADGPAGYFFPKPATPGLVFSGVAVRSNIAHVQPGTRVFGVVMFGSLAEYAITSKNSVGLAPEGVKSEDLGAIGVTGVTAWQTIAPFVKSGDKVLIHGASGGVGTWAIQIAKVLGCTVTAVCSGANAQLCKDLGADEVIDYRSTDVITELKKNGQQFDLVVDYVCKDTSLYYASHHFLKRDRKFVGISAELALSSIPTVLALYLLPTFLGGGQRQYKFINANPSPADFEKVASLIKEGKIKPVYDQKLDLEHAAKGYERLKSHRTRGNILINVSK